MNKLKNTIEALLFVASKPLTTKELVKYANSKPEEVEAVLKELAEDRRDSGIVLLDNGSNYQLATNSECSETVTNYLNSDLKESLTEATSEVLAIIAYRQPISKAEIEAIRGVNSQYSLRALLMRGLIEKIKNPGDARGPAYQVTTDFLQQLGIANINELPDFDQITSKVQLPETPQAKPENTEGQSQEEQNKEETNSEE